MKIAIIGAGNVGGGLGAGLAAAGHQITYGVRDPDSDKTHAALEATPRARATAPAEAVQDAEAIIFALRWDAVESTVAELPSLAGRVVIDAMNRFGGDPARSTAEDLAVLLPGARVVKAFNTIWFKRLEDEQGLAIFYATDDDAAGEVVAGLIRDAGFAPVRSGGLQDGGKRQEPGSDIYNEPLSEAEAQAAVA